MCVIAASLPLSGAFFVIPLCVIHCQATWERPLLFHFAGGSTVILRCFGRSAAHQPSVKLRPFTREPENSTRHFRVSNPSYPGILYQFPGCKICRI